MLLGESIFNSFSASQATCSTVSAVESKVPEADTILQDLLLGSNSSNMTEDFISVSQHIGSTSLEINASLLDSVFNDELDCHSPMFESAGVDPSSWEPLFEPESPASANDFQIKEEGDELLTKLLSSQDVPVAVATDTPPASSVAVDSPLSSAELQGSLLTVSISPKRSISVMAESSTSFPKKDKLGCTPYTRKKRSAPLEPIILSDVSSDSSAAKRARNTEAARRSRARKMERMEQLENKCEHLLKENNDLKLEIERLKQLLKSS